MTNNNEEDQDARSMEETNDDTRWHWRLAKLLIANHRWEQAARHLQHLLRLQPEDVDGNIRFQYVRVLVRLQQRPKAIEILETLLHENPLFIEARVNLAAQLMIDGQLERALMHCEQAIASHPECKEAHYNRNVVFRRLGRQQEAITTYWKRIMQDIGASQPLALYATSEHDQPDDQQDDLTDHISVICVKWGTKYHAEYVNKLYRSICRHWQQQENDGRDLQFVCLTEDPTGIDEAVITCLPLEQGWTGWWNKAQVFAPTVLSQLHEKCIYIDLDTVIVGDLDDILTRPVQRQVLWLLQTDHMRNEQRRDGYNSSIMVWKNDFNATSSSYSYWTPLYLVLRDHFPVIARYIYKFDHWLEMMVPQAQFLEHCFPNQIREYKSLDEDAPEPPATAKIICFPLEPKPHTASAQWVSKHWQ